MPLESEQVREDLRTHAIGIQQRALSRRLTAVFVGFSLLSVGLYVLLVVIGAVDSHQPHRYRHLPINEWVFIPLWLGCVLGGAAVVELRARRQSVGTDPATARPEQLLEYLAVQLEG